MSLSGIFMGFFYKDLHQKSNTNVKILPIYLNRKKGLPPSYPLHGDWIELRTAPRLGAGDAF